MVQGALQLVVAAVVLNERKVDLVLDELEGAVHLVLAPSGHPASHSCAVVELVAELVSAGWQARGVHVRLVQVDVPVRVKERNVVAQPSCVELRVLEQPDHGVLLVLDGLWGVEAACVVLANTDFQEPRENLLVKLQNLSYLLFGDLLILLDVLELVGSSDDLPCTSSVVVAAVIRNDRTASNEVVVLVEDKAGPGKLSRARLSVLETASRSREVPSAALLPRVHHPLVATVPHTFELAGSLSWGNARPTESGVVDRGIVAASLLTKRTSVQGLSVGVGIGSVHDPQPKAVLGLLGPLGSLLPQRLHSWIDQSAANKVIVVVDVATKGVAALLVLGNAAALAEAACELSSTWNSAGRGLAAAALLGERARLASTSTSLGQT